MPMLPCLPLLLAVISLGILCGGTDVRAQDSTVHLTPEAIESRIKDLGSAEADPDDANLERTVTAYQEALTFANETRASLAKAADFQRKITEAPAALKELATEDPGLHKDERPPSQTDKGTLDELAQKFDAIKEKMVTLRAAVTEHAAEEKLRLDRMDKLPGLIAKASADLAALPVTAAPLASASELERGEYQQFLTKRALLKQQITSFQAELHYYETTAELFAARSGFDAQRLAVLTEASGSWQKLIDRRRQAMTSAAAKLAHEEVRRFSGIPEAEQIAQENAELAEMHGGEGGLSQRMAKASSRLAKLDASHQLVAKQHSGAMRRVKLFEDADLKIDPTTGQLLRQQRQMLRDEGDLLSELQNTLKEYAQAQIDLIALEDRQAEIATAPVAKEPPTHELAQLRETREELFKSLTDDYRDYINTLSTSVTTLRSLAKETKALAHFVDQRLLWIPSTSRIGSSELKLEAGAVAEMFAMHPLKPILDDIVLWPILWALAAIAPITLLARRRRYLSGLSAAGSIARKRNCTSYVPTAKALGYTLLIAAPVPAIVWFIYARAGDASHGTATGIRSLAFYFTSMSLFSAIVHPEGLMIDHFRIPESRAATLRNNFRWFIPLMAPLVYFATALPLDVTASSAGRLFFIGSLLCLLVFFVQVLRPAKMLIYWQGRATNRPAKACFFLGVAAPAALLIGAAAGYYASVQQLRQQALASVALILLTLFVTALLHRWILVSRRRLAVQRALKRRAAALAERTAATTEGDKNPPAQLIASTDTVKFEALKAVEVEEQTVRLVRAAAITAIAFGIWGIWNPTVPALSALDKITLWNGSPAATTAAAPAGAGPTALTPPAVNPAAIAVSEQPTTAGAGNSSMSSRVSLEDLVGAFIAMFLTIVASQNIPGLLELTIFRRLQLKPGSSFAFTTTIRYLIVVTGVIIALGMIGITWGKVQWIAAAITLGIGFGLQEIFANFVAGLIILFERPIRLGDVVTVGDVSGRVSQIRIRATTIRQFNDRELIVPNKEFITGQLVNWTLSDSILRLEVPVGIAYGSDTAKATEILLETAHSNPRILGDPMPDVLFESFGDSALAFLLRAHVGNVDDLIPAKNELHYEIDKRFRRAGIEIAFPQSDIHIRSMPEGASQLQAAAGERPA